jgi:TonB family protein
MKSGVVLSLALHLGAVLGLLALAGGGRSRSSPEPATVMEVRLGGDAARSEVRFRERAAERIEREAPDIEVESEAREEPEPPPPAFKPDRPPPKAKPPSAERVPEAGDAAPAQESTVRPTPLADNAPPAYPVLARRFGHEGRVAIRVRVSAAGGVEEASVSESSGFASLDRAALEAVRAWRFTAAGDTEVAVRFRLTDAR